MSLYSTKAIILDHDFSYTIENISILHSAKRTIVFLSRYLWRGLDQPHLQTVSEGSTSIAWSFRGHFLECLALQCRPKGEHAMDQHMAS